MTTVTMPSSLALVSSLETAWHSSFEQLPSDGPNRSHRANALR
jgi:hypothetical protein